MKALAGAVFGGLWAALALKGTILAYEHLDAHPPAHDLPMGLTNNVNQVLITMVSGRLFSSTPTPCPGFSVHVVGSWESVDVHEEIRLWL